jgi:formylmethanofuran dehydrogenase subunit E
MRCKKCGKPVGKSDGKKEKLCALCYKKNITGK